MRAGMGRQFSNALYGVLDYAAYPVGMLAVAPCIVRSLGVAPYGIWAVATSIVSLASIIASGFGDANIQMIARERGVRQGKNVIAIVRAAMGIHVVLGVGLGIAVFFSAAFLSNRLCSDDSHLRIGCCICIRLAGLITGMRAVETVCISTHRGFERYGQAVTVSVAGRLLTLACTAIISSWGGSIAMIMAAGAIISFLALLLQLIQLRQLLGTSQVGPSYISGATSQLLHLGCLTWMLAVSGVIFSYADRLVGGATLGAVAVASYAVCAQLSQPVYGLTAAGLHFLFPYLSRIHGDGEQSAGNRIVRLALLVNLALVLTGTGFLLTFGNSILRLLSTDAVANASAPLLRPVLAGSALLGLTVVGTYGMLALGRARSVAILNVLASIAAVAIVSWLLPTLGVLAIPAARIAFATIVMLLYIPLFRALRSSTISRAGFTSREARLEEA